MLENVKADKYERKITSPECLFSRSPYSIVTVVARIKGNVSESMLIHAVSQVQQRHPNLRVRIEEDDEHVLWFTSEEAGEIPIETVARESDEHWIRVLHEASQVPFEFDLRPAIRFILVQSPVESELIILCHHIICDGLSLAYLARDLMVRLEDPTRKVQGVPDPIPIDRDTIPQKVSLNFIVKFLIHRINRKWEKERAFFDQQDYRDINQAYWNKYTHQMLPVELSEAQTRALVERCRRKKVTVNSALAAAFAGAQNLVQGAQAYHSSVGVAADLRNRLQRPVDEVMGFYAGLATLKHNHDARIGFWENAREFHRQVEPLYTDKNLFQEPLLWCHLEPSILEAFNFKRLGGLVPPHSTRYDKLSAFSERDDVILSLLKRNKSDSLDETIMGTAVTNLTRMDFPTRYGALELDRLIMNPGGAFPLAMVNVVLGAVTCAGKLSLVVEYAEQTIDTGTAEKIKDKAMEFLLDE